MSGRGRRLGQRGRHRGSMDARPGGVYPPLEGMTRVLSARPACLRHSSSGDSSNACKATVKSKQSRNTSCSYLQLGQHAGLAAQRGAACTPRQIRQSSNCVSDAFSIRTVQKVRQRRQSTRLVRYSFLRPHDAACATIAHANIIDAELTLTWLNGWRYARLAIAPAA